MYAKLHLHIYTGYMLEAWPMLINGNDLNCQLIMYVVDIYNL